MQTRTKYIFIALGVLFSFSAFAGSGRAKKKCDVLPKPENVVSVPAFSEGESCPDLPIVPEKLQYEGAEEPTPLFKEETSVEEIKDGARYPEMSELYVDPEPDFILTREKIADPSEEGGLPASDAK